MKKRILHVVGFLGRGGDTSIILNVMNNLDDNYEFCFLTHQGYNEKLLAQMTELGYKIIVLDGDVRKMGALKYYLTLKKELKKNGPFNCIHMHTSMQSGIGLMAAKHSEIKVRICHSHISSIQRKISSLKKIFYVPVLRYLLNRYSTIKVACGVEAGQYLFGKKNEFLILKNGINIEGFLEDNIAAQQVIRDNLKLDSSQIICGQIGRLSPMKNQLFSLKILKLLVDKNIPVHFIFVGDGQDKEMLIEEARKLGINKYCSFVGHVNNIQDYLKVFDVLLFPSLEGEGFPVTLVEAQAANCYSIVSDKVTKDVDLELNLIDVCSLSFEEVWMEKVTNSKSRKKLSNLEIYEIIKCKGYSNEDVANEWKKIYQ